MTSTTPRKWIKRTLIGSGSLRVAARFAPATAVILMYHSIAENPELTLNTIGVSQRLKDFDLHIRTLARRFTPVTIDQVAQFAVEGRSIPKRSVVVTFDDGFLDNYECAIPILNRYGVPATFYILVNAIGTEILPWYCRLNFAFRTTSKREWKYGEPAETYRLRAPEGRLAALRKAWEAGACKTGEDQEKFIRGVEGALEVETLRSRCMLSWDEVRRLGEAGHTIGAHTLSHPNLAHVSVKDARSQVIGSKQRLERELGIPIEHFSYPHPALDPQWSPQTVQITREAGFKSAVLTARGPVQHGDDVLKLKRIYAADDLNQWIWNLECTFLGRSI